MERPFYSPAPAAAPMLCQSKINIITSAIHKEEIYTKSLAALDKLCLLM